jgi:DNA (cytosine-5)-methyltransferase 1
MTPPHDHPTLVDLFCGCGGISYGFSFPGLEPTYRVCCGVDWDRQALLTFKRNHPGATAFRADLGALTDSEIRSMARRVGLKGGQLDVLHGSPPCQPFSANNRSAPSVNGDAHLFGAVSAWARVLRPKAVTLENVVGMRYAGDGRLHDEFAETLVALGYTLLSGTVDAAAYGVPQHRVRLLYVAYRDDFGVPPRLPESTHANEHLAGHRSYVTAAEAIGDLPPREPGGREIDFVSDGDPMPAANALRLGLYTALMRASAGTRVGHHRSPPLSQIARRRIEALKPGEALEQLPKELQPKMGYRGAYGRLHPQRPASTITANCDGPSRGRFSHYEQVRAITLREAARLQSFPDGFAWANPSRKQVAQEIGNAVPPLLAHAIARTIAGDLGFVQEARDANGGLVGVGEHLEIPHP